MKKIFIVLMLLFTSNTVFAESKLSYPVLSNCESYVLDALKNTKADISYKYVKFASPLYAYQEIVGYVELQSNSLGMADLAIVYEPIIDGCYPIHSVSFDGISGLDGAVHYELKKLKASGAKNIKVKYENEAVVIYYNETKPNKGSQ